MDIVAAVFAAGAALLHVYIWVLESFRWTEPATRKAFGTSESDAETTKPMAYNQGFYNLFLAIITLVGVFAGGDIRSGSMKRVASATGEGASVVSSVHAWLGQ